MLSVRNLVKVYKTKGGAPVRALDGVSVDFPEKGMVFLLGRSGSGKSTLLNMAGGLDEPDSGEIIIKGKSSKDFSKTDFDSYRNTYVGFIFQEYNILNEFNVEQNIALALQLQGKKNDKKAVNALLEQVDLKGLGRRKPNTLSGGQKQRIAIARALIKEPEIIMADEPTGALDSRTGRQVLDTLKKLSEKKLVIIVSHDREFAEFYGDRIIELKDGKILSDVSKGYVEPTVVDGNVKFIGDGTVKIEDVDRLSETDVRNILFKIKQSGKEGVITFAENDVAAVKRALKIGDDGRKETFEKTDIEKAKRDAATRGAQKPKFIKSRLPLARAVKMGLSGLKTKPIRLIFTVFLSVVAFTLFGVVATMMNFDAAYSVAKAMESSPYDNVELTKNYKYTQKYYSKESGGEWKLESSYDGMNSTLFNAGDLTALNNNEAGLTFIGVYNYAADLGLDGSVETNINYSIKDSFGTIKNNDFYSQNGEIKGFADIETYVNGGDFSLVGKYPAADDEIAVSDYIYQSFKAYGFRSVDENGQSSGEPLQIENERELIGKQIYLRREYGNGRLYTITGVVKINGALYNDSRITAIKTRADSKEGNSSASNNQNTMTADEKAYQNNVKTLKDYLSGSLHTVAFVSDGFYSANKNYFYSEYSKYIERKYVLGKIETELQPNDNTDSFGYFDEDVVKENADAFAFYTFDLNSFALTKASGYDVSKKNDRYGVYLPLSNNNNNYISGTINVFERLMSLTASYYQSRNDKYQSLYYNKESEKYSLQQSIAEYGIMKDDQQRLLIDYQSQKEEIESKPAEEFEGGENERAELISEYERLIQECNDNISEYERLIQECNDNISECDRIMNDCTAIVNECQDVFSAINEQKKDYAMLFTLAKTAYDNRSEDDTEWTAVLNTLKSIKVMNDKNAEQTLDVRGFYSLTSDGESCLFASQEMINEYGFTSNMYGDGSEWKDEKETQYKFPEDGKYSSVIVLTDNTVEQTKYILHYGDDTFKIKMTNQVYESVDFMAEMVSTLKKVFLIVAAVLGVFSALMLFNFISVSISAKSKEIGILRAVGARGSDVFKIFFAEGGFISFICFFLSAIAAFFVCNVLNNSISEAISIKMLEYGWIEIGLIFAVAAVVSIIATIIPVVHAAKKPPVESIRAL